MSEDNKASIGAGDVEIKLDGKDWVLRPTVRAMKMLSRKSGGIMGAVQSVASLDTDAIASVLKIGLELTEKGAEGLDERVYRTGAAKLAGPCIRFLHVLSNGGRPPEENGTDGDGSKDEGND